MKRTILATGTTVLLVGCFLGDENNWASREDVVKAATRCGIPNFEPSDAPNGAYAAYVPLDVPNARQKEDCIYNDLKSRGLLATR